MKEKEISKQNKEEGEARIQGRKREREREREQKHTQESKLCLQKVTSEYWSLRLTYNKHKQTAEPSLSLSFFLSSL